MNRWQGPSKEFRDGTIEEDTEEWGVLSPQNIPRFTKKLIFSLGLYSGQHTRSRVFFASWARADLN